MKNLLLVFCISLFALSCDEEKKSNTTEPDDQAETTDNELTGKYHNLYPGTTKIYLPVSMTRVDAKDFLKLMGEKGTDSLVKAERDRMDAQKDKKTLENHYFVDLANRDAVTVYEWRQMRLDENNVTTLQNYVRGSMDEFAKTMDYEFERDTEGSKNFGSMQIFKSKYKLNKKKVSKANKGMAETLYGHHYVISNDNRTYVIRFLSKTDTDFDPFISKTIF